MTATAEPFPIVPSRRVRLIDLSCALTTPRHAFVAAAALYLLLCALAFFVFRPTTQVYFADYWEHRAIVSEVIRHGTHLIDPIYGEAAPSRQFTPWTLALGGLARTTGIGVDLAMATGAMFVSVLLVSGIHLFARLYYARPWAPVVVLAAVTCGWGVPSLIWTGFPSLRSQLHSNYYPSALVFSLTFFAWALTLRLVRAKRAGWPEAGDAVLLAGIVAISLVTHPLNAGFLLAGATGLAVLEPGAAARVRIGVAALLAGGVAASALWPYFNPLSLAGAGLARGQPTFNNFDFFFDPFFVVGLIWPASFALVAARRQLADPRTRLPVIAFFASFAAYVVGGIGDVSVSHRFLAFVALALQLMLVWLVLDLIAGRPPAALRNVSAKGWRVTGWVASGIVALHVIFAVEQLVRPWAETPTDSRLHAVDAETRRVGTLLPAGARVLGWDSAALAIAAYGTQVVALPRPMPFSLSESRRQSDVNRFFRPGTSTCDRRTIAARWGATHIAYLQDELSPDLQRHLQQTLGRATAAGPWRIITAPGRC